MSSEEQQPGVAGDGLRPSLEGAPGSTGDPFSILASVEGHARHAAAPTRRSHWAWLAGGALAVSAAAYVAWQSPIASSEAMAASNAKNADHEPALAMRASAPNPPAPAAPAVEAPAATATARIETVATSEPHAAAEAGHPFAALSPSSPPVESAVATVAAAVPSKPAMSTAEPRIVATAAGSGSKKRAAPRRERASQPRDTPTEDADVDLLAALMAHVAGHEAGTAVNASYAAPTIAELVRSCRALAAGAARRCRQRICEGYWGKAEACPVQARAAH